MTIALTRFTENMAPFFGGLEDVWFPSLLVLLAVGEKLTSGLSVGLMDYLLVWYLCFVLCIL